MRGDDTPQLDEQTEFAALYRSGRGVVAAETFCASSWRTPPSPASHVACHGQCRDQVNITKRAKSANVANAARSAGGKLPTLASLKNRFRASMSYAQAPREAAASQNGSPAK